MASVLSGCAFHVPAKPVVPVDPSQQTSHASPHNSTVLDSWSINGIKMGTEHRRECLLTC